MLRQVQVLIQILEKGYKTAQEKQTLGIHRVRISLRIIQTISLIQARKLERQITLDIRVEVIHLIVDQDITKIDLQDRVMTPIDPLAQDTKEETLLALDQALDITEVTPLALNQVLDTTEVILLAPDQALDIIEVTPLVLDQALDTIEVALLALDQALDITEAVLLARADLHLVADLLPEVHLREEEAANKIFLKKLKSSC